MLKKFSLLLLILILSGAGLSADLTDEGSEAACNPDKYEMKIVVLTKTGEQPTEEEMKIIRELPSKFEREFHRATWGEREIIVDDEIEKFQINGSMTRNGGSPVYSEIIPSYFEKEPEIDFLSFYAAYETENIPLTYTQTQNYIQGIGQSAPHKFGETWMPSDKLGKLRGITFQGELDAPSGSIGSGEIKRRYVRGLLHEIGHQWCCFIGNNFDGEYDEGLELLNDGMHYYPGLYNPTKMSSPMNADHWIEKEDGNYERTANFSKISPYHPITMYLMTGKNVSERSGFPFYDAGVMGEDFDDESAKLETQITLSDVIENTPQRKCVVKESVRKNLDLEISPEKPKVGKKIVITPKIGSNSVNANIWINNKSYSNKKQLEFKPDEEGTYRVGVSKSENETDEKIVKYDGMVSTFYATLEKINRSLKIDEIDNVNVGEKVRIRPKTNFGGVRAEIIINNQSQGKHQNFEFSPKKAGNYTVEIKKSNRRNESHIIKYEYKTARFEASKKRKKVNLNFTFSENPVYIGNSVSVTPKINGSPVTATIQVGNNSYEGQSRLNFEPDKSGKINVEISKRNLNTTTKIVIFESEEKELNVKKRTLFKKLLDFFNLL